MSARNGRWLVWLVLPVLALACGSSSSESATSCTSNVECARLARGATCGPNKTCVPAAGGSSGSAGSSGGVDEAGVPLGGPLASIAVTPATASVAAGQLKQFTLVAKDASGNTPYPYPTFTWSVSGGGTIGATGLFNALTVGGPYTITAASGAVSATATVTVTPGVVATITMGETTILNTDDSGNGDNLLAQEAMLVSAATIGSLSFYVAAADGNLRLGVYDATGPDGGPGNKKAETAEFAPVVGWNTAKVLVPVLLPAGTYWLAYTPSSNDLHFERADDGTGNIASFANPYGPMPDTFSTTPNTTMDHWSFYATLTP
jgi:hypothetical protein